jgi:excisionase family DNA binding protein
LLSIREAAAYLNKSYETVSYSLKSGQIPYRQFGARKLIPIDALNLWLQGGDDPDADRK